jgi:NADPH:quinone reductase-like Zn-dependent oxidoreductase
MLEFPVRDLMSPAARVEGFLLPQWIARQGLARRIRAMRLVGRLIASGVLASDVGRVFPIEDFRAALEEATRPGRGGKALLRFS